MNFAHLLVLLNKHGWAKSDLIIIKQQLYVAMCLYNGFIFLFDYCSTITTKTKPRHMKEGGTRS